MLWLEPLEGKRSPAALLDGRGFEFKACSSPAAGSGSLLLLVEWAFGTAASSGPSLEAPGEGNIGCKALGRAFEQTCPCPAAALPN